MRYDMVFILSHIQEQAGNKFEVTLGAGVEQAFKRLQPIYSGQRASCIYEGIRRIVGGSGDKSLVSGRAERLQWRNCALDEDNI